MSELILIVDDDHDLVRTLEHSLRCDGYRTLRAPTGREALLEARLEPIPDLIVSELTLPGGISGTEVCRQIRQDPRTQSIPVLLLTAKRDEVDRIVGFEVGADDYVVKPFSVRELMLRIRAILRRTSGQWSPDNSICFGRLAVDLQGHRVKVDEVTVNLTPVEFKLLVTFLVNGGKAWTRQALLSKVWNIKTDVQTRTVDVHVKRLREKLRGAGRYIETVRGVGYRLCTPSECEETAA
jgi:two-component system phosphate regulon response regulator PhoB